MDTSETYVKTCEKAYPILGKKKPEEGDYWYIENKRDGGREVMLISGYNTDSGVYGPGIENDGDLHGWELLSPIYRQDQLQAMMKKRKYLGDHHLTGLLNEFNHWAWTEGFESLAVTAMGSIEMEQLWLAFVMREKYGKTWDGEEWVTL